MTRIASTRPSLVRDGRGLSNGRGFLFKNRARYLALLFPGYAPDTGINNHDYYYSTSYMYKVVNYIVDVSLNSLGFPDT